LLSQAVAVGLYLWPELQQRSGKCEPLVPILASAKVAGMGRDLVTGPVQCHEIQHLPITSEGAYSMCHLVLVGFVVVVEDFFPKKSLFK